MISEITKYVFCAVRAYGNGLPVIEFNCNYEFPEPPTSYQLKKLCLDAVNKDYGHIGKYDKVVIHGLQFMSREAYMVFTEDNDKITEE